MGNSLPGINDNVRERGLEQKCFRRCRKVDRDGADITLSGRLFQMVGPATGKARPPTIDSFTDGTSRRLVRAAELGTSTRQIGDTNEPVDSGMTASIGSCCRCAWSAFPPLCSDQSSAGTVAVQLPASADNVVLPTSAAVAHLLLSAGQQSTDVSCSLGPQQRSAADEWDRQTDRQTDERTTYRYIDRALRTVRAVPTADRIGWERMGY